VSEQWQPLSAEAEKAILDAVVLAVARSKAGLDDGVMSALEAALRPHVEFETVVVVLEEEDKQGFRVFMQGSKAPPFPQGVRFPIDRVAEGFTAEENALRVVVEDTAARSAPVAQAMAAAGLRSYVGVAITAEGRGIGWLGLSHREPGAPSRAHIGTLEAIAHVLAPALECARSMLRLRALASLVERSEDGMLVLDPAHVVREANRASLAFFQRPREEVIGRRFEELAGEQGGRACELALQGAPHATRVPFDLVAAGEVTPIDLSAARLDDNPEASIQVVLRDARPRRAAEAAAAKRVEQLAFLRALGETIGTDLHAATAVERGLDVCFSRPQLGAMGALRTDGAELRLVASRGLGPRARAHLAQCTFTDIVSRVRSSCARSHTWGALTIGEEGLLPDDPQGTPPRWMLAVPLAQARRALGALLIVGTPGAPLTEAERDLWEAAGSTFSTALHSVEDFERVVALEAEKRQLVDNLPAIVARIHKADGLTSFVNAAVERVLGVPARDLLGRHGLASLLVDDLEKRASESAIQRAAAGETTPWEDRRYRHASGRVLTLREHVHPVRDADGSVRAVEIIAYDVTTEIESRKRLMQSDRLASLGALAAGIAHEINNPVAFIGLASGQLDRLVQRIEEEADPDAVTRSRELIREIGEATERIATIVGELKLFTRVPPEGAIVTPVDVNRILQMALTLTGAELRRRATVEIKLGDLPLVPGEFSMLGQAFVNLLINAAQAIEEASSTKKRHTISVTTSVQDGNIVVTVKDSGEGIPFALQPRIFEPFFTTRASGGAGLGLTITYDLVRRVGGDIRVTSAPGEGSTFEVILPIPPAEGDALASRAPARPSPTPRPRPKVLIIDDEAVLAKALARHLAERYDVETAVTAREAHAHLAAKRFDVVVCDLGIPDQAGRAIYETVLARSPQQAHKFVFTTGGGYGVEDDELQRLAQETGLPVLEKPFDPVTFERVVSDVARSEAR
jgi:PAS domain S-box-containing protein